MIVATLNPKKKKMTLTSIPRDTVMSIPGYSSYSPSKINSAYDFGGAGTAIRAVQKLLNVPIDYYGLINMGGLEKIVDGVGGIDVTPKLTFKYGNADVKKGVKIHLDGKAALDYSRMRYDDPKGDYGEGITINGGSYEYVPQKERQRVTNFIRNALDLPHKTTGTTGISSMYTGEVEESDATSSADNSGTSSNYNDPNNQATPTPTTPSTGTGATTGYQGYQGYQGY